MSDNIPVTKSSMPKFVDYVEEIKDLWDSKWLTNMGEKHKKLEGELLNHLQVPNITLFSNGHLALESIIAAYNLQGEVITTPFTFASTTHAIVRNGLTPIFCDINYVDYTIDVKKLESLITEKTCAILPVHVFGNICDVNEIEKIARKYNLKVIYDAAHTFGVELNGKGIGSFGDASIFSFHATKVFNTIEGGAVTYNNKELYKILNGLKNFGITGLENVEYVGGNAKMNEFQAAMGLCNLKYVESEISKRKAIVKRYRENFKNAKGIKLVEDQIGVINNYSYFPVVFEEFRLGRDQIFELLQNNNITARKYFYPLTSSFECYKEKNYSSETPTADYVSNRILTLPLYADMEINDVDRICNLILG